MNPAEKISLHKDLDVYLFCGIASSSELESHVRAKVRNCWLREFPDHYYYDRYDLENILEHPIPFGSVTYPSLLYGFK